MSDNEALKAQELFKNATHVVVFSGAGMSVPLGTPTYWSGTDSRYGSDYTEWELTALEHATGKFWWSHPQEQTAYFRKFHAGTVKQHQTPNHYHELLEKLESSKKKYFNVTSNIDNAFIYSGFDSGTLYEIHGSTRFSQCLNLPHVHKIFTTPVDENPVCPECGSGARPNTLFFDDLEYMETIQEQQFRQYRKFVDTMPIETSLILEIGAGVTINTIRNLGLRLHTYKSIPFVRINPNPYPDYEDLRMERAITVGRKKHVPFHTLRTDTVAGLHQLY